MFPRRVCIIGYSIQEEQEFIPSHLQLPCFFAEWLALWYTNFLAFQVVLGRASGIILYLKGKRVVKGRKWKPAVCVSQRCCSLCPCVVLRAAMCIWLATDAGMKKMV